MDFAKNILSKYGWTEGQGIGKNLDGIVKPIKANLKFDKDGLGHDKAKDFTNHWWENAYNDAANNIDVEHKTSTDNEAVAISLKSGESIDISTNGISVQKMRNRDGASGYEATFRKMRSTLNSQIAESSDDDGQQSSPKDGKKTVALTDEELLRACGGRTAHKGARHGLSLSGKLSRIEEQERQLLEKYSNNFDSNAAQEVFKDWVDVDTGKKKKKRKEKIDTATAATSPDSEKLATLLNQSDYVVKYKSKKKRRRHRAIDEDLATALSKCLSTNPDGDAKSESKLHGVLESSTVIKRNSMKKVEKKKNKKKKKAKPDDGYLVDGDVEITEVDGFTPEQRKYLKHLPVQSTAQIVDEVDTVKIKQSKKTKRKHKETFAGDVDGVEGDGTPPKLSKHEKSKLMKDSRKVERIARKLENIMSLDETDAAGEKSKKKKKKKKASK